MIRLVDENTLVIAGPRPRANDYAVYDLMHRFAGYRWFAPGELGQVIRQRPFIDLPADLNIREEPSIESFANAGTYYANGYYMRSSRQTLSAGHNLKRILRPADHQDDPDRFCMVNGKRFVPPPKLGGTWQPCVTHPDLPRLTLDWARDYFKRVPYMTGFSACVNDGGGDCQCPKCLDWKQKYANQYVPYYNEVARRVARKLPGKAVGIYAYGGSDPFPKNVKLEPNVFVLICSPFRDGDRQIEGWAGAGAKMLGIYQYLYGRSYMVPRHYPHLLGKKWKETYRKYGLAGAYTETYTACWFYDGPRQYVMNNLAWNIDADIDALLDDYFTNFYGGAASHVRRFFDRFEEVHARKKDPFHFIIDRNKADQLYEFTQADVDACDAALLDARKAARDETVKKRLGLLAKMWSLSRLDIVARVRIGQLEAARAASPLDRERAIALAGEACAAIGAKGRFTLTAWEEANLLVKRWPFEDYKRTVQQEFDVETAVDAAFGRVWDAVRKKGGADEAKRLFEKVSRDAGETMLGRLARTRLYLAQRGPGGNRLRSPGFETGRAGTLDDEESALLKKYDWTAFKPDGWSTWHFQQSVTRFHWDGTEAHSGKRSVAIGRNQIMGCFQQYVPVTPGERYRLGAWVKQRPSKGASVIVRWVNEKGWVDQGPQRVPGMRLVLMPGKQDWRKLAGTFTVPEGVTHAVVLLSAPRQEEGEMTWYDDITFERIWAPEAAEKP